MQKRITNDFAFTNRKDAHTRVDTGACRLARTSKTVNCKITVTLDKTALNYKTLYEEKQTSKKTKYDTAVYKTQKHFLEKREHAPPPAEISCGADNSGAEVRKN